MHLYLRSRDRAVCYILAITIILLACSPPGFSQVPQIERSIPTQENPRIVISNADVVTIDSWNKHEVSITTEAPTTPIKAEEVTIKTDKNRLEISCHPTKPDRKILLTLRVPLKSVLEIKAHGNTVQVKEPAGHITIGNVSKELVELNVPVSTALDLQGTRGLTVRNYMAQGSIVIGGNRSTGKGPPYVKVAAPTAHVAITFGFFPAPNQFPKRPVTMAAQTIARRGGIMGQALRRSNPQLIRPQHEQTASLNSIDREEGALKLETYLVNLNVSAMDRTGKAIPGLKQEDFSVYEDGVPQRISFFSPEQAPFNLVLLLDLSGSMRYEIELIKETAIHFLDVIRPQDSVAVVTFTTDVTVVSQLTKDRDDLRESIEYMLAPAGGTAFYDAVGYALVEVLRKVKGQRNAVIAITDGEDNALPTHLPGSARPGGMIPAFGSFLTFETLLDGAREADALIYPIHLDPAPLVQSNSLNPGPPPKAAERMLQIQAELTEIARKQLHELADASGGRFYHANRIEDLKGVFEQVAAELRTVYTMAYTPKNLNFDGRFRRIHVQTSNPDVAVRTRPGYYGR